MSERHLLKQLNRYDMETAIDVLGHVLHEHFPPESRIRRRYENLLHILTNTESPMNSHMTEQIRDDINQLAEQAHLLLSLREHNHEQTIKSLVHEAVRHELSQHDDLQNLVRSVHDGAFLRSRTFQTAKVVVLFAAGMLGIQVVASGYVTYNTWDTGIKAAEDIESKRQEVVAYVTEATTELNDLASKATDIVNTIADHNEAVVGYRQEIESFSNNASGIVMSIDETYRHIEEIYPNLLDVFARTEKASEAVIANFVASQDVLAQYRGIMEEIDNTSDDSFSSFLRALMAQSYILLGMNIAAIIASLVALVFAWRRGDRVLRQD